MRRRSVLTAVLVWTLVVAAVSAVTWAVIDAAGQDLLAGDSLVTDAAPALTATTAASPEGTTSRDPAKHRSRSARPSPDEASTQPASPTQTRSTEPARPATAPPGSRSPAPRTTAPTGESRTWEGPPGVVSVRCDGAQISLRPSSPSNGYRIEVERGATEIEVHFKSTSREYQVKARCSAGTPRFTVESSGEAEGDD